MPTFDSIRKQAPWMQDWSDEEVMLKLSELTNTPLRDVAKDFGINVEEKRNPLSAGFASGIDQLQGLGYSGAAALADVVGAKGARDWLERQSLANEVQAELAGRPDLERIEEQTLGSALPYLGYQVAKQAPNILGAVAAGALVPEVAVPTALSRGAAMLPRALGGGSLDAAAGYAAKKAALETGKTFGKQVVGGLAFNEAQSVGSLYQAAREGGDEDAGAKALLGSPLYALSETLPEAMLVGRLKGGSGFTGNILTRMGKSAGVQGISGATSEGLQNEMEMALNPTLTEDQKFSNRLNSIAAGGLVEGVLGGLGGMSKGGRLPSRGSLMTGANASDQPETSQTPDDRGINTAIDSSSGAQSVVQNAEIDQAKLSQEGVLPPEAVTAAQQTQEQLAQAKQEADADAQAQRQAQMRAEEQQKQRVAALDTFGVIPNQNNTAVKFMGQTVAGPARINALADFLHQATAAMSPLQLQVSQAAIKANQNTGGKLLKFKVDGNNAQKTAQNSITALANVTKKYMIDEASSIEEVADILNAQSLEAKGNELEQINALYEALTGQNTDGYNQSQGDTNGTLQTTSRMGTVPVQGGTSQAAGGELGLLQSQSVQPVATGSVAGGPSAVQANAGREGGVRAGAGVTPAASVSGNVSAPSPQVTEVPRGQIPSTTAGKPVAGTTEAASGGRNVADGAVSGESTTKLSPEQAEAILKDVPQLLRRILGNVFRSAKKVEFLATFQKKDHFETHEQVGERLGLKKGTVKDYAKLLSIDEATGIPKFISQNLEAFQRAFANEARKLGITPAEVIEAINSLQSAQEESQLEVSERELAEMGLAVQETQVRRDVEGKKTGKVDRTNVTSKMEQGKTAEALSNQYIKLVEAQEAAQDEGDTAKVDELQQKIDDLMVKITEADKREKAKVRSTAGAKEEKTDAVQERSAEEVPVRKRAAGGEGVRKENTGKRKAAKEVIKTEAEKEVAQAEQWDVIAEQYGLPKFDSLSGKAQAAVMTRESKLTLAAANDIFDQFKVKQLEKGVAPTTRISIVDADQTTAEDMAAQFPVVKKAFDQLDALGIGKCAEAATVWATTTEDTFTSDGVYEVLPGGWQGVMFHEDALNPNIDPDAHLNVVHEVGHAVDMAGHGGIYSYQIEMMLSAKDGKIRPMGVVAQEMYKLYETNEGWKDYLTYPFDHTAYPKLANNAEAIRIELFAQMFAAYNDPTLREAMRLTAPVTYKYMTEVVENVKSTKSFLGKTEAAATVRRETFANRNAKGGAQLPQTGGNGGANAPPAQSYDKISNRTNQWVAGSKGVIDSMPTWARGPVRAIHNVLFGGKETALGLMITEDIAELAKKFMKSVTKYIEVQHFRNSLIADKERRLTSIKTAFEELDTNTRRAVNDIIASSTINGKWAFDPQLGKTKVTIDPALAARFKALPASGQKVIREVFAVGRESLQEKKDTIRKIIDEDFADRMATAETDAEKAEVARRKTAMEKQFSGILNINPDTPYSPLKRFGPFVVVAKSQAYLDAEANNDTKEMRKLQSDENHYIVEFAETAGEAESIYDDLNATRRYKVEAPFKKSTARDSLYRGTDLYKGFAKLKRVLAAEKGVEKSLQTKDAELLGRLETMVNDLYLLSLADSSARKSEMERKKIAGFNRDMMRAFFTQGMADAHYIANLKTADQSMDTMVQMQKEAGENRAEAYPYLNELMAREAQALEIREPSLGDAMNRMAGDWFLTFSPSFYFQQLTQTYVLSLPWLAGKYNYFKSARALQQAYKQILPLVKGTGLKEHMDFSKAPEDVRELLQVLVGRGRIDIGVEAELGGFRSESDNPLAEAYTSTTNRLRGAINRIEALNRSVAAIAAYRLEMQKSGDKAKAIEAADKVIHVTHGSYDGFNTPRLFNKNAVTRSLTQFRRFQIIQLSMLARMVHNAFKGASATEKAMGRKQLAFLLGHTFALGGIKGMPIFVPAAFAYSLLTAAFGDEDDPEDFEAWLRSKGGVLLARGIPANMGIDLSGKLGMGNVLSVLPYTDVDLSSKQGYANLLLGASGPFLGGLVPKMLDGVNLVAGGDYYRGLEQMLPNGLNNGIKMVRFNTEGVTMRNGDVVMSPEEIGFADTVFQGLGLPTTTVTERQYRQGEVIKFDQFYKDRSAEVKKDYIKAYKANDPAALAESREEWNNLQESRVKYGYTRRPLSELMKAPREQVKRERSVVGGIETTKANKAFVSSLSE